MSTESITKLPKWAQQRIQALESNVAYWKTAATAGPEQSDTFVRRGLGDDTPLGEGVTIRFRAGVDRDAIEVRNEGDGSVTVRTSWRGMLIEPQASNSVRIRQEGVM